MGASQDFWELKGGRGSALHREGVCCATLKNLPVVADRGESGPVWEYQMELRFPARQR